MSKTLDTVGCLNCRWWYPGRKGLDRGYGECESRAAREAHTQGSGFYIEALKFKLATYHAHSCTAFERQQPPAAA